jgi:hypothetical protein
MENIYKKLHQFISIAPHMTVLQHQTQQLFYNVETKAQAQAHAHVHQRNHLHAQTLNNSASLCIESGQYNKAISFLAETLPEALHLLRQHHVQYQQNNTNSDKSSATATVAKVCRYQCCSLDGCIAYSEDASLVQVKQQEVAPSIKDGNISHKSQMKNSTKIIAATIAAATYSFESSNENRSKEGEEEGKYIHRKPIHVTPNSLHGGHNMGSTLSLIVAFNLALALQLKAADTRTISNINTNTNETLRTSMCFYEIAYKWQAELVQPSLRFNLILCNNLGQIHRMEQNHLKHEQCLQHLLSMLMYVIDCERTNNTASLTTTTTTTRNTSNTIDDDEEHQDGNHYNQQDLLSSLSSMRLSRSFMDLDGFLQNTVPIILKKKECANAA